MTTIIGGNSAGLLDSSLALLNRNDNSGNGTMGDGEESFVNISNGNLVLRHRDIYMPSLGEDFTVVRTYNSRAASSDAHEHDDAGWQFSTGVFLDHLNDETGEHYVVTYGDGSEFDFRYDSTRRLWVAVDGAGAYETLDIQNLNGNSGNTSTSNGGGNAYGNDGTLFVVTRADQTVLTFDKQCHLLSSVDPNGVRMDYEYNADKLVRIRDDQGHVVDFVYNNAHLEKIVDETGAVLAQYKYDQGRMVEAIDRIGHSTRYSYNSNGVLDRIDLPAEQVVDGQAQTYEQRSLSFEYEPINWNGPSNGQEFLLSSVTDAQGGVTTFNYDLQFASPSDTQLSQNKNPGPQPSEPKLFQGGTTQVVDALGNNRAYSNEQQYVDWRVANGFYAQYDAALAATDATLQSQVDAIRAQNTMTYTVNRFGNIEQVVDQQGYKTTYTYDARENLTAVTDRNGYGAAGSDSAYYRQLRAELGYVDAAGLGKLVSELTATEKSALLDAFTTRYTYDSHGNLLSSTDNSGYTSTFTYTDFNKVASSTRAEGVALATSDDQQFQARRVELGYAASVSNLSASDKAALRELYTTHYEYDAKQNLVQRTDPGGDITRFDYDIYGNLTKRTVYLDKNPAAARSQVTQYFYDLYGNNVETIDAEGNRTFRQFDHFGNMTLSIDGNNGATAYTYDADNRLLSVVDAEGHTTYNTYDAVGNRISFRDANGHLTIYTYDRNNMLLSTINNAEQGSGRDRITQYSYDVVGNRTSATDAEGRTTRYAYDNRRQLVEILSALVADENGNDTQYASTIAYDGEGNRIRTTNNRGYATDFLYNRDGLLIQQADASGQVMRYTYDADRNQIMIVAGMQLPVGRRQVLRFGFDEEDQLVEQIDAEGGTTTYAYTATGRRASVTDANGHTTDFEFDRNNRLLKETRPAVTDPATGQQVRYTVTHQYDANGNEVARTDENGHATRYAFDRDNRLVMVTDGNGINTVFSYDSRDNRTGVAIGVQAHMDANRHVVIDGADGAQATTFTYDEFNQLVATTDGVGNALAGSDEAQYQAMRQKMGYAAHVADLSEADRNALRNAYTDRTSYDRVGNVVATADHNNAVTAFQYDSLNRVTRRTDALGNATTYGYDGNGNRVWQRDALGRIIRQAFDQVDRLVSVTDPLGVATVRSYDAFGNLVRQVNAAGTPDARTSSFEYDLDNRLVRSTDGEGHQVGYEYDAVGNRLKVVDGRGNPTRYVYDALNRNVKMIDPLGFETRVEYDGVGNKIALVDARGGVRRMEYDAGNRLVQVTDAEGRVTRYEYDVRGNQVKVSTAYGTADVEVTRFEYDAQNNLRAVVDAEGNRSTTDFDRVYNRVASTDGNGHTTVTAFDALHRVLKVTNPEGEQTSYSYDAVGNRLTRTDPLGRVSTMSYDADNRVIVERAADGVETRYAYDKVGNRVSITTAANTAQAATTSFVYDLDNRLVEQVDPLGHATRYEYDQNDNRTRVIDPEGHATRYVYDADNRVAAIIDALGNTVQYRYDGNGNRTQVIDARGNAATTYYDADNEVVLSIDNAGYATESQYDKNGNVVAVTLRAQAVGLPVSPGVRPAITASPMDRTTRFAYDRLNRLKQKTDAEGYVTRYQYDAVGNRTRTELFLDLGQTRSEVTRAWYDGADRQVALLSAEGYLTTYGYDDAGNRTSRTQYDQRVAAAGGGVPQPAAGDAGRTTRYQYDAVNRLVRETSPLGVATAYEYDQRGNRTAVIDAAGTADERRTQMRYDAANRLTDQVDALGTVTHFDLDDDGLVVNRYDAYGTAGQRVTHFDYDAGHRLVRQVDTIGTVTDMSYDAAGNLLARTIAVGTPDVRTERFEYDRNNRTVASINGEDERTEYAYDAAGNMVRQTQAPGLPEERTTGYEYDRDNRLLVATDPNGLRTETRYDGAGNKVEVVQARGIDGLERHAWFTYDLDNRLVASTDALGGVTSYQYDALGNQTRIVDANGGVQVNTFDALGRMVTSLSAGGVLTRNAYDLRNNITSTTQSWADGSDARTTSYRYDLLDRQVNVTDGEGFATAITYDRFGNQTRIDHGLYQLAPGDAGYDAARAARALPQSNSFVYDRANRMLSMTDAEGNVVAYGYDAVGNRTSMTEAANSAPRTTTYRYDRANRLVETRTPEGGIARSTYNEVGDKVGEDILQSSGAGGEVWIHKRFEYDHDGRMTAAIDPYGVRTESEYDAVGNLVATRYAAGTPDERVVRTEYDLDNRKTADIDAEGNRTSYQYDSMGNRIKVTDAAGRVAHYYYNAGNELVLLVDPENYATAYAYDSAGNRTSQRLYMQRLAGVPADGVAPVPAASPDDRVTTTVYNRASKAIAEIAPDGTRNEMTYDGAGNLVQEKLFANTPAPRLRTYAYDHDNRLVNFVDVDGTVTRFTYDGANNRTSQSIISSTDPNAVRTTVMRYDLNNRKIAEVFDPDGLDFVQAIEYDKVGNVVRKVDANGNATTYEYDLNNRLVRQTDPLGGSVTYALDLVGNQVAVTDARGNTTNFEYDGNNRVVKETQPAVETFTIDGGSVMLRPTTTHRYDAAGNEVQTVDPNGNVTTRYFDGDNRETAEINADNVLTEYTCDAAGERTSSTLYMNRLDASAHDPATRPAAPAGESRLTRYEYDLAGRLVRTVYPSAEITTLVGADTDQPHSVTVTTQVEERTVYDAFGNAVTSIDRNGNATTTYYDTKGRRIAQVDPLGYLMEFDYDAQDNITEQRVYTVALDPASVSPSQRPAPPAGEVYVTSRRYDAASRLVEEKAPQIQVYDPATRTTSFVRPTTTMSYDAVGHQTVRTLGAGTPQALTEYSYYDADGRKVAVINANRVVHLYQYDANGNMTLRKRFYTPVPGSVDLASLTGSTNFAALVTGTNDDQATEYTYDAINRLTSEKDLMGAGAADDLVKGYRYDAGANRTAITDEDGFTTMSGYDSMNRVVRNVGPDGNGSIAQFDAAGNQVFLFTGKISSRALPALNIGATLGDKLKVSWDMPTGSVLRSWVVYDTASHDNPSQYAQRSAEHSSVSSSHAEAELGAGGNVYFRVVTEDIAGNQTWSEEKLVTVPPRFHDVSVAQPAAGTLVVTAHFDDGAVAPTLYVGTPQNANTPVAFVRQADGSYKATLTGVTSPQGLDYRLGWADAAGHVYSSAESSFALQGEHVGISTDVGQGVVSSGGINRYTIQLQTRVPAGVASHMQALQMQWRPAGSTGAYASAAVEGVDDGSGNMTYSAVLGEDALLDAGNYEVRLTGVSADENLLLDTFEFKVGADATPAKKTSLAWNAPSVGDSQLASIDGQLVPASRVDGRLLVDADVAGTGTHNYEVRYTSSAGAAHNLSTSSTPITQTQGTPPVTTTTGYKLKIGATFDPAEAARIKGGVRLEYRAQGAAAFGAPVTMAVSGSGYETTLDQLAAGTYEVRLSYTDVDGNEVVADWTTVKSDADASVSSLSQTVLARETGSYQIDARGQVQVAAGLYTGAVDEKALAGTLTLAPAATGMPPGSLTSDGSTAGYFAETRYNALNMRIASNGQDGLWRTYGVDGNGNAVETRLYGTLDDLKTPAFDDAPAVSYAAYDARNRKVADFGVAFTVAGESAARQPVTRDVYNVLDKVVAHTDAMGYTTRSEYNAVGIKTRDIDAEGNASETQVDIFGHETAHTDALGHTSTKFYDRLGRLAREVDATGYQTVYGYDVFDRRVTVTDGLGALTAVDGDHTTVYHYDQRDRVVQVDLAEGWHLAHDADGIYAAERARLGYGDVDSLSDAQRAELQALYTEHATYDGRNNRTSITDANGHMTREVFDALGRVTDTVTMQNGQEVHNRREYDIYGNLAVEVDGDGRTSTHRYAGFGRLVEETDAGGERTTYTYNRLGQKVTETSTGGKSISRTYDDAGHLLTIDDQATGVSSVFGYNANGQRVLERITTPGNAHNRDIMYQYDSAGRQVRWADSVTGLSLNYAWDAAGNQRRVYTDAGAANAVDHRYRYDDANRVTGIDGMGGAAPSGGTFSAMMKMAVDDIDGGGGGGGGGSLSYTYGYDAAGNRISYSDGSGSATYTYDAMNRVVSGTQGDSTSSWAYDRVGNVMSYTGEDGKTTTYQYYENNRNWYSKGENETISVLDKAGHTTQMTMKTFPKDGKNKTFYYSYSYMADGREASIRAYGDATGTTTDTYDADHHQVRVDKGKGDGQDRAEVSTFVYSNEDKILYRNHDTGTKSEIESTEYLYANGYQVGETGTDTSGNAKTELDVGRYNLVQAIGKENPGTAVTSYVAHEGETLQSIAAAVYGNPNLWYVLADTNGLGPTDQLKAGTEVKIPTTVRTGALTADTHRVYNESDIIGSTLPNLKSPPPPKKGCASIIMMLVAVVVAVVAPYAIAALATWMGPVLGSTLLSTMIASAVVAAGASIITQGVAIALGLQEKFSWSAVGKAAATAFITAGVTGELGELSGMLRTAETAQYAKVASAAIAMAGEATKQLISNGKITSWSSLAMAGASTYAQMGASTGTAAEAASYASVAKNLQYVSPWLNMAETAVRNGGKLQASDWANAVGSTLGTALSNGDVGSGLLNNFEGGNRKLVSDMLVGGVMTAISRETGTNYLINGAATWAGTYLGDKIGMSVFGDPEKNRQALMDQAAAEKKAKERPVQVADSGQIMSDAGPSYAGMSLGAPVAPTPDSAVMYNAMVSAFESASEAPPGARIQLDDFGNALGSAMAESGKSDDPLGDVLKEHAKEWGIDTTAIGGKNCANNGPTEKDKKELKDALDELGVIKDNAKNVAAKLADADARNLLIGKGFDPDKLRNTYVADLVSSDVYLRRNFDGLKDWEQDALTQKIATMTEAMAAFGVHRLSDDQLRDLKLDPTRFFDKDSDYQAALYKDDNTGSYLLANRGTQSLRDARSDMVNNFGSVDRKFELAAGLADTVYKKLDGDITFVGHSLGGGLASAQAARVDGRAITFNAAGLTDSVADKLHLHLTDANRANVEANYLQGDLVSGMQDSRGMDVLAAVVGTPVKYATEIGALLTGNMKMSEVSLGIGYAPEAFGTRHMIPASDHNDTWSLTKHYNATVLKELTNSIISVTGK